MLVLWSIEVPCVSTVVHCTEWEENGRERRGITARLIAFWLPMLHTLYTIYRGCTDLLLFLQVVVPFDTLWVHRSRHCYAECAPLSLLCMYPPWDVSYAHVDIGQLLVNVSQLLTGLWPTAYWSLAEWVAMLLWDYVYNWEFSLSSFGSPSCPGVFHFRVKGFGASTLWWLAMPFAQWTNNLWSFRLTLLVADFVSSRYRLVCLVCWPCGPLSCTLLCSMHITVPKCSNSWIAE